MGRRRKYNRNISAWPAHCYTCEYRIEDMSVKDDYRPTFDVKGCKLQTVDRESCRRWRYDEYTANKTLDIQKKMERWNEGHNHNYSTNHDRGLDAPDRKKEGSKRR